MAMPSISDIRPLSFSSLLISLTTYFVVERLIKKASQHVNPVFCDQLYRDRKDTQYFAFVMGILITVIFTPVCYKALHESSDSNDILGQPHVSTAGQICLASRSVLWISELNRLDHSNGYIMHHISSLSHLVYHIQTRLPLRFIYAFYTSLATELFSDLACLMTIHGLKAATSPLAYRVQVTNTFLLIVLRIPPIIYATTVLPMHSATEPLFWMNAISLFIYARFILNTIIFASTRLQIFQFVSTKPAHIRIVQKFNVPLYSAFFSIASFTTAILTARIYMQTSPTSLSPTKTTNLNLQLLFTGLAAALGARTPSSIRQHGPGAVFSPKILAQSELWIQCAISAAAVSILASPLVDRYRFLLSLALALPVGEAIGRVGCYFAGCCGGSNTSTRISVQVKSAFLNATTGLAILAVYELEYLDLEKAAMAALAANAVIRILVRPNIFAVVQFIGAVAILVVKPSLESHATDRESSFSTLNETRLNFPHDSGIAVPVDIGLSQHSWTVILALGAVAAGSFVQGCGGGGSAKFGLTQGCGGGGSSQLGLIQGCGGGGSSQLGLVQGCGGGGSSQLGMVQGCGGGGSSQLGLVQGCGGGGSAALSMARGCGGGEAPHSASVGVFGSRVIFSSGVRNSRHDQG